MKRPLLMIYSIPAIAALLLAGCDQAPVETAITQNEPPAPVKEELITVHNPAIAGKLAERLPLSPRLDTLEGKTIYMVDVNWGGIEAARSFYEEMQNWFNANIPSATIILKRTQGNMFTDDPALWKEISEQGDAAIVGIGS